MSVYQIAVTCTKAQWEEICEGFYQDKIAWPLTYDGVECHDYTISCSCKWSSNPFHDGSVEALSAYYPTAVFYCSVVYDETGEKEQFWLLAGETYGGQPGDQEVQDAARESSLRYLSATSSSARGVDHSIELMPNGKVAYDGQNVFGECDVLAWKDMKAIACGDWHTVGQTAEGKLLACGSNANGQCDVELFGQRLKQVSCGRYHTAILFENGKVSLRGALEAVIAPGSGGIPSRRNAYRLPEIKEAVFPVSIDIEGTGYHGRAARVDRMQVGDALTLRVDWNSPYYNPVAIEVFNQAGESLGYLRDFILEPLERIALRLGSLTASVESVTPLAARRSNAKYPLMTVRIEESEGPHRDLWELPWENIVAIRSIHDAVIGVDAAGQVYSQGSHGLDDKSWQKLIHDLQAHQGDAPATPGNDETVNPENEVPEPPEMEEEDGDASSLTAAMSKMFDDNIQGYCLAYMLHATQQAEMVELSEEDQERFGGLLASRAFHKSIGTDVYLFSQLADSWNVETMELMIQLLMESAEDPEFVGLIEKALKANPGYQDVLAKALLHLEGMFEIKFGLNLNSFEKPVDTVLSETPEGEEEDDEGNEDILSRALEAFESNIVAYSLKLALMVISHKEAESMALKEEEELFALIRSDQLRNALGTDEVVEDLIGEDLLEKTPELLVLWMLDKHELLVQSYYQAVLDSFPRQQRLVRRLFDSLAEQFEYQPGFQGSSRTGGGGTSRAAGLDGEETAFRDTPAPDEPARPAGADHTEAEASLGQSIPDLQAAVKALALDEDLVKKHAAAIKQQEERRQKESAALEKARAEALKAGKSVVDEVNMFVILHNEKALRSFGRDQQAFFEIYEDDFLSLSREEMLAIRKNMKADLKDEAKSRGYRSIFMERSGEDRFLVSALNLFNVKDGHDIEGRAEFAVEHAAQWFREEEQPWLRHRMQEELAQIRASMREQIQALDERWVSYDTAKEMLRPYVREDDDTKATGNVFEQRILSHLVLLQLATPGVMQMTMNLPDAMAWFWGVSITDIWDQACKNPPYAADGIDGERAGRSVEAAHSVAKAVYGKKDTISARTPVDQPREIPHGAISPELAQGSEEGTIASEAETDNKGNMAEVLETLAELQKQADELHDQMRERIDQINRETEQKQQAMQARREAQAAEAERKRQAQPPAKKGCYLATAVYGSYDAPEVRVLRRFRDQRLERSRAGRLFIRAYYRFSPSLASRLGRWPRVNAWVKRRLDRLVRHLGRS